MDETKRKIIIAGMLLLITVVVLHAYGIVNASEPPPIAGFTTTPEPVDTDEPDPTEPSPPDPTEPSPPDPTEIIIINPRRTNEPDDTNEPNPTTIPQTTKTPSILSRTTTPTITGTVTRIPQSCVPEVYYMVKYVCGLQEDQFSLGEPSIKAGNYATAINLHNFSEEWVCGLKRPALDYSEFDTKLPPAFGLEAFEIAPLSVLEVDCNSIWASTGIPHGTFIKGMIEIGLGENLPAVAVYTAQITDQMHMTETGAGISIDVEYLNPFIK
jgi:hypothetical protein